jgi:cell division inhibitor SepF
MASVWRKTMRYLGLVEEDDYEGVEAPADDALRRGGSGLGGGEDRMRRVGRAPGPAAAPTLEEPEAIIRTIPQSRPSAGTIHRAEPKRFNEAREVGERFKEGIPVIMNLQETEDGIARRLVDFASGLVFAHDGKIELVANRVYLLTPHDMEVSAEERERIREGGFFNQF